jgi:hypothetical protein
MEVIYTLKAGYLSKDTYNMDETGFCWKKLPNSRLRQQTVAHTYQNPQVEILELEGYSLARTTLGLMLRQQKF